MGGGPARTGTIEVEFHGGREAAGPLTFAQHDTLEWVAAERDEASAILRWTFVLPDGARLPDVAAAFAVLMTRHESLRTTFDICPEAVQRVAADGRLGIQIYEIDAQLGTDDAAGLLLDDLCTQGIDFTSGLPLRVAVGCTGETPRVVVAAYSHMIADFGSMAVIGRQFTALVADPAARIPGPPTHQPLDQAQDESTARGRRRSDTAIEYWRTHLEHAPQALYALPAPAAAEDAAEDAAEAESGHVTCVLVSLAGALALGRIADRTRAGRHAILLAATCAVLSHRTGVHRLLFTSISGNRFRSRLTDYVGNLAQDGLVVLDADVTGFDELVGRAVHAAFTANVHSSYDPRRLWPILEEVGHRRGIEFARDFVINNLSDHLNPVADADRADLEPADSAAIARAQAQTTVVWLPAEDFPELLLCAPLRVDGELVLAFTADTEHMARPEIEAFARAVESLLIAAADCDLPLATASKGTGLEPADRGADWLHIDSCWVHLPSIRQLILDVTPSAAVFPDDQNHHLTAYLTATDEIRTPQQAHLACMGLLPDRHTAMTPGHYVLCDGAPEDPTDELSWQKLEVIAEGDGRNYTGNPTSQDPAGQVT